MKLENLAENIYAISYALRDNAAKSINKCVTARNWLVGYYIVHYEQNGEDRAKYGDQVLKSLASKFNEEGLSYGNLKLYRQFYKAFPELGSSIAHYLLNSPEISQPLVGQLQTLENKKDSIGQPLVSQLNVNAKYLK